MDTCPICGEHWLASDKPGRWDPNYVHYGDCLTEWWAIQTAKLLKRFI
jgi:hypothetical protein